MPTLPTIARVSDDTTVEELLTLLHECSRYAPSAQRTASTDTLLDLLLAWAGAE